MTLRYSPEEIARYRARGLMPLDAARDLLGSVRDELREVLLHLEHPDGLLKARRRVRQLHRVLDANLQENPDD